MLASQDDTVMKSNLRVESEAGARGLPQARATPARRREFDFTLSRAPSLKRTSLPRSHLR